jgi:hypothetical protein
MSTFKYLPQYFSTTLNVGGGIDASQTTGIVLLSVSGVDITKPGQICISYSDPLDTGVAEWINYTSINGSNELVGVTRGCEGYSAHTHLPSAVIQFTLSATHLNDMVDVVNGIKAKDLVTTGGGTTTYTLTPTPAVGAYVTGQEFNIKMNATNTGASTINVSGLGAKSLTKGGATALASGDLLIDATYKITYDGTQFQVSGISASATAATRAEIATGTSNTVLATPQNLHEFHVPPQGFLYNGKIVPSVASNNLTVALKGLDGNDPSATNPVYVRIGDTVRSITAALSVTKNAGTNYHNAGSAELATKEVDYFVYLGYNATDGIVIGFSRIPYATVYSDFSATFNDNKFASISTITNAAAGDVYELIGRFAATMSAGAGYTWSVPTFTATNLIQRPIYETRQLIWAPTVTGVTTPSFGTSSYFIKGNRISVLCQALDATSNATTKSLVLPMGSSATHYMVYNSGIFPCKDGGAQQTVMGHVSLGSSSSTLNMYKTWYQGLWTASGAWAMFIHELTYQI